MLIDRNVCARLPKIHIAIAAFTALAALAQAQQQPASSSATPLDLVVVTTQITNPGGVFLPGLTAQDFKIFEDDVPQPVSHFAQGDGAYYLAYNKPAGNGDGIFHKIRVVIDRPGLIVRARDGYATGRTFHGCWKEISDIFGIPAGSSCY